MFEYSEKKFRTTASRLAGGGVVPFGAYCMNKGCPVIWWLASVGRRCTPVACRTVRGYTRVSSYLMACFGWEEMHSCWGSYCQGVLSLGKGRFTLSQTVYHVSNVPLHLSSPLRFILAKDRKFRSQWKISHLFPPTPNSFLSQCPPPHWFSLVIIRSVTFYPSRSKKRGFVYVTSLMNWRMSFSCGFK